MKISKVDHTRAGVIGNIENKSGVLYKTPEGKKYNDLLERVKDRNNKTLCLYKIFARPNFICIDEKKENKNNIINFMKLANQLFSDITVSIKNNKSISENDVISMLSKQLNIIKKK